jgi:hypothetical protein
MDGEGSQRTTPNSSSRTVFLYRSCCLQSLVRTRRLWKARRCLWLVSKIASSFTCHFLRRMTDLLRRLRSSYIPNLVSSVVRSIPHKIARMVTYHFPAPQKSVPFPQYLVPVRSIKAHHVASSVRHTRKCYSMVQSSGWCTAGHQQ